MLRTAGLRNSFPYHPPAHRVHDHDMYFPAFRVFRIFFHLGSRPALSGRPLHFRPFSPHPSFPTWSRSAAFLSLPRSAFHAGLFRRIPSLQAEFWMTVRSASRPAPRLSRQRSNLLHKSATNGVDTRGFCKWIAAIVKYAASHTECRALFQPLPTCPDGTRPPLA